MEMAWKTESLVSGQTLLFNLLVIQFFCEKLDGYVQGNKKINGMMVL